MRRSQRDCAKRSATAMPATTLAASPPPASSAVMDSALRSSEKRETTAFATARGGGNMYGATWKIQMTACHKANRAAKTATAFATWSKQRFMRRWLRAASEKPVLPVDQIPGWREQPRFESTRGLRER